MKICKERANFLDIFDLEIPNVNQSKIFQGPFLVLYNGTSITYELIFLQRNVNDNKKVF